MEYPLRPVEAANIEDILREADETKAILPTRDDPGLSMLEFCTAGEDEDHPGFRLFTLEDPDGGSTGFIVVWDTPRKGMLYIGPMYIRVDSRGRGLGRLQVERIIEWCRENGYTGIFTNTWGSNAASRKVFEKLGFHLIREIPDARVDGDSTVSYILDVE